MITVRCKECGAELTSSSKLQFCGCPNQMSLLENKVGAKDLEQVVMITNDVGTKRGADYQYSYDTLYNGIHDWNDGDVLNGKKAIIIVKPNQ